jgi:signal recognition particle GTPase
MLTAQWQEQIESLKQELADEIAAREEVSERTVPSYICINNLKSKLNRLREIADILSIEKYKLVFIGTIGKGKTTAICHLLTCLVISKFQKLLLVRQEVSQRYKNYSLLAQEEQLFVRSLLKLLQKLI